MEGSHGDNTLYYDISLLFGSSPLGGVLEVSARKLCEAFLHILSLSVSTHTHYYGCFEHSDLVDL